MADGGANISRGINRGAAQVYDTSGPVNMYARLMQQQQLKRAAETKALTDELGKITPEGIRQPDVQGFVDQFGKWRSKAIEADAERNPIKKALLKQEAEREKLTTFMYKDDSKNELINERKRKEFFMNPENRNRYSKEVVDKVINSGNLAKDDKDYVRDINQFEIKPDLSKIKKLLDDTDDNLLKYTQPNIVQEQGERLGVKGLYEYNQKTLTPAEQATAYSVLFDTDEGEFKAFLRGLSPDFVNLPEKELKETAIPILVQERPKSTYSDKKFIEPEKGMTEYQRRRLALAEAEGGGSTVNESINVTAKTFTGTKLPQKSTVTGKPILDKNKKQVSKGKGVTADFVAYSTVNPPSFQMPQLTQAFNIDKGKNEPINTEDAVNLTGIGYVKTKGGGTELRATIKVKGEEWVIKPEDLPVDIRTDKKYYLPVLRAVKEKFGEISKQKTEKSTTPANPTSLKSKGGIPFTVE